MWLRRAAAILRARARARARVRIRGGEGRFGGGVPRVPRGARQPERGGNGLRGRGFRRVPPRARARRRRCGGCRGGERRGPPRHRARRGRAGGRVRTPPPPPLTRTNAQTPGHLPTHFTMGRGEGKGEGLEPVAGSTSSMTALNPGSTDSDPPTPTLGGAPLDADDVQAKLSARYKVRSASASARAQSRLRCVLFEGALPRAARAPPTPDARCGASDGRGGARHRRWTTASTSAGAGARLCSPAGRTSPRASPSTRCDGEREREREPARPRALSPLRRPRPPARPRVERARG